MVFYWCDSARIVEAFYLTGEVEKYGTGFIRIRNRLKQESQDMELSLRSDSGSFCASLGSRDNISAAIEPSSEGLSEGLKLLLQSILHSPGIQAKDLNIALDRPIKTIERQIRVLTERGLIERRGSRKTGGYYARSSLVR